MRSSSFPTLREDSRRLSCKWPGHPEEPKNGTYWGIRLKESTLTHSPSANSFPPAGTMGRPVKGSNHLSRYPHLYTVSSIAFSSENTGQRHDKKWPSFEKHISMSRRRSPPIKLEISGLDYFRFIFKEAHIWSYKSSEPIFGSSHLKPQSFRR